MPSIDKPSEGQQIKNLIALEGNGIQAGVMSLGKVSKYSCPECDGVLVQIEEVRLCAFAATPVTLIPLRRCKLKSTLPSTGGYGTPCALSKSASFCLISAPTWPMRMAIATPPVICGKKRTGPRRSTSRCASSSSILVSSARTERAPAKACTTHATFLIRRNAFGRLLLVKSFQNCPCSARSSSGYVAPQHGPGLLLVTGIP